MLISRRYLVAFNSTLLVVCPNHLMVMLRSSGMFKFAAVSCLLPGHQVREVPGVGQGQGPGGSRGARGSPEEPDPSPKPLEKLSKFLENPLESLVLVQRISSRPILGNSKNEKPPYDLLDCTHACIKASYSCNLSNL